MNDTQQARSAQLGLSGERTVPGVPQENYWFRRHEIAYEWILPRCRDAVVLEAGCGEGYGADLVSTVAARVVAVDYDLGAVQHVGQAYPVDAVQANLGFLPLTDACADVVVNMQVIEHLWDQLGFLRECRRVLRPGGQLLISTPNRLTFSPGRDTPLNPYHTRELAPAEMVELLTEAGFAHPQLFGVHHGPRLRELDAAHGGSIIDAQLEVVMHHLPGQAAWPEALLNEIAGLRAADFEVHSDQLDVSLDLLAIAERS